MDKLGFSIGNLKEGYRDADHGKTSRPAPLAPSTASSNLAKVDLAPMTREEAAKLTRRLLAGYPNLGAHDPEGYVAALVEVMSEFPAWAGNRVVHRVDEEKPEFPPSDRILRTWLADAVRPYRFVQQWEVRAAQQLAERQAVEQEQPQGNQPQGKTYDATQFAEAVRQHGRPVGPFENGRQFPYRG